MERRKKARLSSEVVGSQDRAAGTVLDMSEGGLSVQTQLEARVGDSLVVRLQLPGSPDVEVEALLWHSRRIQQPSNGQLCWVFGLMLSKAPGAYFNLLPKADPKHGPQDPSPVSEGSDDRSDAVDGLVAFRIRIKSRFGPRTRTLSLSAETEAEARSLATEELGDEWQVLEVRVA